MSKEKVQKYASIGIFFNIIWAIVLISLTTSCKHSPTYSGCNEIDEVRIIKIENAGSNTFCWYKLGTGDVGNVYTHEQGKFWFRDSIGKYKINDVLNK